MRSAVRTLGGVLRSRVTGKPVPIAMTMALTYRCNLRCRYCQIWKEAGDELTTRQVLGAIDELHEAGMCRLGLTGGEPLLRPDLGQIVAHARDLGLFTTVFTNGALVPEQMDTMRLLDAVLLSLDGPQEVHDAMRGKGAFEAALRAMELLGREGIPVWTNTVLTTHNVEHVGFVLDLARRHGALAAFQPVFEHSYSVKGDRVEELRAAEERYAAVVDRLLELKRSGAPLLNSTPFFEYIRTPRWEQNPRRCLAGQRYGAVSPTGKVAPCPILLQAAGLPDGRRIGYAEAFRRSARHIRCAGCYCIATVESDLLFSLDPRTVLNTAGHLVRQLARRRRRAPAPPLALDSCMASVALGREPCATDQRESAIEAGASGS